MNARKILLTLGVCLLVGISALVVISIYFLQSKENKENSDRTAKARAARWTTKESEPPKENAPIVEETKPIADNDEIDKLS